MAECKPPEPSRRELRREFPHIHFKWFNKIIDLLGSGEAEALREVLREEDEKARLQEDEQERALLERFHKLTASMLHRKLEIPVRLPPTVNREHLQAYLVYGLVAPSSTKRFVGANYLPQEHIRQDVRNKLGSLFRDEQHRAAENYLLRAGVIQHSKRGVGGLVAYSLNISEGAKTVTPDGRAIIIAAKRFMHDHRPNNGH